ncbi:ABC transporter permease [Psychromarinibacter sp. S121]|uniref:ABC transporter permease n=1 Tax=Psychromarinibacter sp. S121 TaxID=3415127 RepID=UPI003C7D4584
MLRYLLSRLISLVLSLAVASLVIFAMLEIIPGDPAAVMLGLNAEPEAVAALRTELGLDLPLAQRYAAWVGRMLQGDFGTSYTYRVPVADLISARLGVSLPLTLYAIFLSTALAIPLGVWAASRHGRPADLAIMGVTQLGIAVPNFWFAMILVLIFAIRLGWFASGGFPGWDAGLFAGLKALTLPALALALLQASILARVMRSSLLETLHRDYIRTARAKGLSRSRAILRHAFRNALIPVMTILGMQVSVLIAGAIVVENVFFLPGLGRLIFQAVTQRDLIVVEAVVMLLVFAVVVVNFLVDLAYAVVDPRLRRRA